MNSKQVIGVVDYKVGNLKSIFRSLNTAKVNYKMVNNFKDLRGCDKFILPGVGNFGYCVKFLKKTKLDLELIDAIGREKIVFGICMGMQIMFKNSEEADTAKGLNLINGKVRNIQNYFKKQIKVPHIGWNKTFYEKKDKFKKIFDQKYFYFANSYVCETNENCSKSYFIYQGKKFLASIIKENILGTQFHPEISGNEGLKVYESFLKL